MLGGLHLWFPLPAALLGHPVLPSKGRRGESGVPASASLFTQKQAHCGGHKGEKPKRLPQEVPILRQAQVGLPVAPGRAKTTWKVVSGDTLAGVPVISKPLHL